jgi:hypothetical protein
MRPRHNKVTRKTGHSPSAAAKSHVEQSQDPMQQVPWDYVLGFVAAIISIVLALLPPKDSKIVVAGLVAIFVFGIYPVRKLTQSQRLGRLVGFGVWGTTVILFGIYVWPAMTMVTFKDAPAFTWWRRQVIKHDITKIRTYFIAKGIEVPPEIPPFTIALAGNDTDSVTPAEKPIYRDNLGIRAPLLSNRMAVTSVYIDYIVERMVAKSYQDNFFVLDVVAGQGIVKYFNSSYWGKSDDPLMFPYAYTLWDVHQHLGSDFADRIAVALLHLLADSPNEGASTPEIGTQLCGRLKIADGIVEANRQRWPELKDALKRTGQSDACD